MKRTIDGMPIPDDFEVPFTIAKQIGGINRSDAILGRLKELQKEDPFGRQFLENEIANLEVANHQELNEITDHLKHKIFQFKENRRPQTLAKKQKQHLQSPVQIDNRANSNLPTLHLKCMMK